MNSSPNPEPTISMAFIAGLLALMSILSLFSPQREISDENDGTSYVSDNQIETCVLNCNIAKE